MAIKEWTTLYPGGLDGTPQMPDLVDNEDVALASQWHAMRDVIFALQQFMGSNNMESGSIRLRVETLEDGYDFIISVLGNAGGDLDGSYPNPMVVRLQNMAVSSAVPIDGYGLTWNVGASQWESSKPIPGGIAGGDLSGTYPKPTVAKLRGRTVSSATPYVGEILTWNGSLWVPALPGLPGAHTLGGTQHTADTFAHLNAKVTDASLVSTAMLDAYAEKSMLDAYISVTMLDAYAEKSMLDAYIVAPGAPTDGYGLTWNVGASQWESSKPIPGGTAGGDLSGTYPKPMVAKLQGRAVSSATPYFGEILTWDGVQWTARSHALGGASHTADTFAHLNAKVSDADLVSTIMLDAYAQKVLLDSYMVVTDLSIYAEKVLLDSYLTSDNLIPYATKALLDSYMVDATTSAHGLLPILEGTTDTILAGDGTWIDVSTFVDIHAIHSDIAGEIADLDEKSPAVADDYLMIEDSEDMDFKKRVQIRCIPLDILGDTTDNTNLDATTFAHGLLPRLEGTTDTVLAGDGTWTGLYAEKVLLDSYLAVDDLTPFGRNYQTVVAEGTDTTTSSGFKTRVTLTTPALTGSYRINYYAELSISPGNQRYQCRLYNSTDATELCYSEVGPTQNDIFGSVSGFCDVTFAGVAKTFLIQYASQDNSATVTIRRARVEIWRET